MAATESDRSGRQPLTRRLSLRLRLTLLYGGCFLLAAAAVLGITYGLVAHETAGQARQLQVNGQQVKIPQFGASGKLVSTPSGGYQLRFPVPRLGRSYSNATLAKVRRGALAMSECMRAHGLDYPNLQVDRARVAGTVLLAFDFSPTDRKRPRIAYRSAAFKAANRACSPLLDRSLLGQELNQLADRDNHALATQRSQSLRSLLTFSALALGAMALVSILLGWLMGGRALRPLRRMTFRARQITEENLHERLSVDTQEDELGELATTFDGVLARLQRAFGAQQRFVANASHELRTPVTVERTLLEVALADPDADAETLRRTCERVLASSKQQQQTIEALLALARSQGGTEIEAPVDLADVAQDAITLREQRLAGFTLAADLHSAPLTGDAALIDRLVSNLLDNAIVHNVADDGWISVETGHSQEGSWLRVSNSGPEIPDTMIPEIFEPFRRADGERTATATGLGLGLSIVEAIAEVHRATIEAAPVQGGGLRVEVRF